VLAQCRIPVCLVSNIDNAELESALRHNDLAFDRVVTSEDCKAYKPRGETFERALALLDLSAAEVLHVGDSLGSDVRGAKAHGIRVLWINRRGRRAPTGHAAPDFEATDLRGLLSFLKSA
jgi:HAD superfamily hydrolase (TIGR01509 family)